MNKSDNALIGMVYEYVDYCIRGVPAHIKDGAWCWDEFKKWFWQYRSRVDKVLEIVDDRAAMTIFKENGDTWNNIDIEKMAAILEGDYDEIET